MHRLLSAGALALVLSSAAVAQDAPAICFTPDQLAIATKQAAAEAPDKGIRIAAEGDVQGVHMDHIIIIQGGQQILAFMFEKGCMVGQHAVDDAGSGVDDGKPKVGA